MNAPMEQDYGQPTILVNIAGDDPTRGDAAGWRGLAREVSKRIGARVLYADYREFSTTTEFGMTSPAEMDKSMTDSEYQQKLAGHLEPFNPPQIIFGHQCNTAIGLIGHSTEDVHYITSYNESLSSQLIGDTDLVSHHLTKEDIEAHGAEFDKRHPDIKKPVIALFLVDPQGDESRRDFCDRMAKVLKHYPEATVYLCASRRTEQENYDALMATMQEKLKEHGLNTAEKTRVDVTGYAFDRKAEYNPYKGLIARAKHFVVWGNSQSMMSEALFSGKTVYLYSYGYATDLTKKGCVRQFNELSLDHAPFSKTFEPINLTTQIAEKLVEKIRSEEKTRSKRVENLTRGMNGQQRTLMEAIRLNYRSASRVPEGLKTERRFVEAAVSLRGFSLQFFPAFQDDPAVARKALNQNASAVRFVGAGLLNNTRFAMDMVSTDRPHFHEHVSDRLKDDYEFMTFCSKYSHKAYESASERLRKDPNFVMELVLSERVSPDKITREVMADRAVALKIIRKMPEMARHADIADLEYAKDIINTNPKSFESFTDEAKRIPGVCEYAIEKDPYNYEQLPDEWKERDDIVMSVLDRVPELLGKMPEKYRDDKALALAAIAKRPLTILTLSDRMRGDIEVVGAAMKQDLNAFMYAHGAARNNAEFALQAISHSMSLLHYLGEDLKQDTGFWAQAVIRTHNPRHVFSCIPREINADKGIVTALMHSSPRVFADCLRGETSDTLTAAWDVYRSDPEMVRVGWRYNHLCYAYAQGAAKQDVDLAVDVVSEEPSHAHYVDDALKDKPEFWTRVIDKTLYLSQTIQYMPYDMKTNEEIAVRAIQRSPSLAWEVLREFKHCPERIAGVLSAVPELERLPYRVDRLSNERVVEAILAARPDWQDQIIERAVKQTPAEGAISRSFGKSLKDAFNRIMGKSAFAPEPEISPFKIDKDVYYDPSIQKLGVAGKLNVSAALDHDLDISGILDKIDHKGGFANAKATSVPVTGKSVMEPTPVMIRQGKLYIWTTNATASKVKPDGQGGADYDVYDGKVIKYDDAIIDAPKSGFSDSVGIYQPPLETKKKVTLEKDGVSYVLVQDVHTVITAEANGKAIIGVTKSGCEALAYDKPVVYEGGILGNSSEKNPDMKGIYVPVDPVTGDAKISVSFASKADLAAAYGLQTAKLSAYQKQTF